MTPSAAEAAALLDALLALGVRAAVLSPGSRSAPLALALARAERSGRLRLHVRIDERSAGFLALGIAKTSGTAVPVVATSGTAVANLFPAVIEASYAGVPLLVLSADRPHALRFRRGIGGAGFLRVRFPWGRAHGSSLERSRRIAAGRTRGAL